MSRRQWIAALVGFFILFVVSSGWMHFRNQNQELWGRVPLIQLSAGWMTIFLLIGRKFLLDPNKFKLYLLGISTALLLGFGFPPLPLPFLLFVGFVPLLMALDGASILTKGQRYLLIYHTFLLWNIFSTYWVANSSAYAAGVFANTVNALVMSLPILGFIYVRKRLGEKVALVAFTSSWIAFEFLHMHWDLLWPWLTLGNGLSKVHWAIQWYEYTGALGGSALILGINYLIYQMVKEGATKSRLVLLAASITAPLVLSLWQYGSFQLEGEKIEVVVVQPNYEPHYEKFGVSHQLIAERIIDLARPLLSPETDYLVLPETSFSGIDVDRVTQPNYFNVFRELQTEYPGLNITLGIGGRRFLNDPVDVNLPTTRSFEHQDNMIYYEDYNAALQLNNDGTVDEYYKALFVPGAEFFPFRKILFFLKPIVDQLGGTLQGYRTRIKYAVFDHGKAIIAPPICYESIFGEYVNQLIRRGSQVIFIMTNDGWWDKSAGYRQHAQFAKLRAIETRREIARSANMGTTCFVNGRGDLQDPSQYGVAAAKKRSLTLNNEITFYVRWGDVIGRVSVFIIGLLLLRSFVLRLTA